MQEKIVRTWDDTALLLSWIFVEIIIFFLTSFNPAFCFLMVVVGAPFWAFIASLLCEHIPFLQRATFKLYYAEELPPHRIYHILRADDNGYILYRETDSMLVSCWCIDHPIKYNTKEIWNAIN